MREERGERRGEGRESDARVQGHFSAHQAQVGVIFGACRCDCEVCPFGKRDRRSRRRCATSKAGAEGNTQARWCDKYSLVDKTAPETGREKQGGRGREGGEWEGGNWKERGRDGGRECVCERDTETGRGREKYRERVSESESVSV